MSQTVIWKRNVHVEKSLQLCHHEIGQLFRVAYVIECKRMNLFHRPLSTKRFGRKRQRELLVRQTWVIVTSRPHVLLGIASLLHGNDICQYSGNHRLHSELIK